MKDKPTFQVFSRRSFTLKKQWYWRMLAANNEIIAVGTEPFDSEENAWRAIRTVKKYMANVKMEELNG